MELPAAAVGRDRSVDDAQHADDPARVVNLEELTW
jgi:hypothetical protein